MTTYTVKEVQFTRVTYFYVAVDGVIPAKAKIYVTRKSAQRAVDKIMAG